MGCSHLTNIEILSPAGDFECLTAAVNCGADAVYLGGAAFSARANAANFDNDTLRSAVDFAHLRGVKVYVALNTLILDSEIKSAFDFIKYCCSIGVDALIVQDLGIAYIIGRYFPDFRIHASTQMTIHNLDGVKAAAKIGFRRVVLSRELSYDEIEYITKNTDTEIEVFSHGALCMCYSGQCLMSSLLGGRSGNRGACAQPCRLPYTVLGADGRPMGEENKYYMSLKDLCLIDDIDRLRDIGVTSLKTEGRMKNKEYVALVTHMYDKYRRGGKVACEDKEMLENIFSRSGFTNGYVYDKTGAHMLNKDKNNDNIYRDIRPEVERYAESLLSAPRTIGAECRVKIKSGELPEIELAHGEYRALCRGDKPVETAQKVATDKERIISQIKKLGGTPFHAGEISCEIDDNINIPIKTVNELRRNAADKLADKLCASFRRKSDAVFEDEIFKTPQREPLMSASVVSAAQARAAYDAGFDRIYIGCDTYLAERDFFDENRDVFALMMPTIERDGRKHDVPDCGLGSVCISNISQLGKFTGKHIIANFTMNVFNKYSAAMLAKLGADEICVSAELTLAQIEHIQSPVPIETVVYGRLPLMTLRNCLIKSASGKCGCKDNLFFLKDRKNACFPVKSDRQSCTNTVYNSVPVYLGDRINELRHSGIGTYRFIFTTESPSDIADILRMYQNREKYPSAAFTRGHWYRGVEQRKNRKE